MISRARTARQPRVQAKNSTLYEPPHKRTKRVAAFDQPESDVSRIRFQQFSTIQGLRSQNQDCYLNSVVQLLRACEPVRQAVADSAVSNVAMIGSQDETGLLKELHQLFLDMTNRSTTPPSTANLQELLQKVQSNFIIGQQQDLTEAVTAILGIIHNCTKTTLAGDFAMGGSGPVALEADMEWDYHLGTEGNSVMWKTLGAQIMTNITCSRCGSLSSSFAPICELNVKIPPDVIPIYGSQPIGLPTLIEREFRPERISNVDCDTCNARPHAGPNSPSTIDK